MTIYKKDMTKLTNFFSDCRIIFLKTRENLQIRKDNFIDGGSRNDFRY